ncbi:c-type cytochrome [Pseudaestuariivita sp.]|uniref:c-type cytochrome n=1 Tax=Pseudaestuariivita sp. TaxID=2211669 RepID=UPI0040586B59
MRRLAALVLALGCATLPARAEEFTTLKGHGGPIMDIVVTPSGQVVTASFDNALGLWEGRTPTWLDGHTAAVITVLPLPDGRLVSGGDDFTVRLWEGGASKVLGTHKGKVTALAVSGDDVLSASWDGTLMRWPLAGGEGTELIQLTTGINDVAILPGGDVVYATSDGEVWRQSDTARRPLVRHGFGINQLVVGPDWIAYGAVDGGTRVIDFEGDPLRDFTLDRRPILAMDFDPDTAQLGVGDGHGYIMLIDTHDWRISHDYKATRQGPVWALAFSPDGQTILAGGLDDAAYAWPIALLDTFDSAISGERSFLREADSMPNGERQFMRKCSICHALTKGPSRKAGPTLHNVFGRQAGTLAGYIYSDTLDGSPIVWDDDTIDALFDEGPDHYIPGSKMPMQVIAKRQDRADLIAFLKEATKGE